MCEKEINMKNFKSLNVYLSNIAVLYAKLHNLHWNVKGSNFKAVHEYLEEIYDAFNEEYDAVAELMIMQGATPFVKMADYLANSEIKEIDSKKFSIAEALEITLADIEHMKKKALEIRAEADEADNFEVANMMEDHIENYNKTIWFIKSSL